MRTRTFVFSFVVHTLMIGAAMVVRLFATTELPAPPENTMFAMVSSELPEVQPPPAPPARTSSPPAVNNNVVPLREPDSIAPGILVPFDTALTDTDTIIGALGDPVGGVSDIAPPPPAPRPAVPPPPVRPGGVVRSPQKVHHVAPLYPPIAQQAKISGVVILEALIAEDGSVRDVKVLRSVPLLDAAATDAVRQWRFTPTLLNGVPVQVIMSVTVTFTLN
ncbi:MAG: energy transducer TonB [Vicinamibacterales bacterium]